jgi:lipoprotein-anchoring transpeptidase ErfK/SrfK
LSAVFNLFPRPVQDVLEAQIALAREGLSPGSLDGLMGPQTRSALRAYQQREGLPVTGQITEEVRTRLLLHSDPLVAYTVTTQDCSRLMPLSRTWVGKSQQAALEYESILELLAERGQSHPDLLCQLNSGLDWKRVRPGTIVTLPDVACPEFAVRAALLLIRLGERTLEAYDSQDHLLVHFPCSIAQRVDKRPLGELRVAVVIPNPNYTFNPEMFPESEEARRLNNRLVLPPGPNNPVGTVWIGLDKPGYGIHGTPSPEQVGRTESHGCFRLANWNAECLLKLVATGTPVFVEP